MSKKEQSKKITYDHIKQAKEIVDLHAEPVFGEIDMHKPVGRHLLIELFECQNFNYSEAQFQQIVRAAGCTPLKFGSHCFDPEGSSAFMILSESHLSVHTYPEHKMVFADLFTCGDQPDPYKAMSLIKDLFKAQEVQIREVKRGI